MTSIALRVHEALHSQHARNHSISITTNQIELSSTCTHANVLHTSPLRPGVRRQPQRFRHGRQGEAHNSLFAVLSTPPQQDIWRYRFELKSLPVAPVRANSFCDLLLWWSTHGITMHGTTVRNTHDSCIIAAETVMKHNQRQYHTLVVCIKRLTVRFSEGRALRQTSYWHDLFQQARINQNRIEFLKI